MLESNTISYAIIGAGEHALRAHAVPGSNIPSLNLIGFFDPSKEAAQVFQVGFGSSLRRFTSEDELLGSNVYAIIIASPDSYHPDSLAKAIKAGKHVLIEKPLINFPDEVEILQGSLRAAESSNLVITSCHPRRFDPPFLWVKSNLDQLIQELGAVTSIDFDFSYHQPQDPWKINRSLLLDHANHEIDLVNFLLGHSGFTAKKLLDGFDRYEVAGIRQDDVSFQFRGTRRLKAHDYREYLYIRFNQGYLALDTNSGFTTIQNHETGESRIELSGVTDYPVRFKGIMANFAAAIRGEETNYLSPNDLWVNNLFGVLLTSTGEAKFDNLDS